MNKGNPLPRLHGNTQRVYIANSYTQVNNNTNESHCCVSTATTAKHTRYNVTLHKRKLRLLFTILRFQTFRRGVNEIFALLECYAARW